MTEDEFDGYSEPKGHWQRVSPDSIFTKDLKKFTVPVCKEAINETLDLNEEQLEEWIDKNSDGNFVQKWKAAYIKAHHPLKVTLLTVEKFSPDSD